MSGRQKFILGLCLSPAFLIGALLCLRIVGLLHPFSVPTGAMSPTISPGDHVLMEDFSYLARSPRRGDNVVFTTSGITSLPTNQVYVKRIVGEPGEHVQFSSGNLFINGKQVMLSNAQGVIAYNLPHTYFALSASNDVVVPVGGYFVVGDNATNSFDSRFWGSVPRKNIMGRIWFCYWPPARAGFVK